MKRSFLLLVSTLAFPLFATVACGSLDANTGSTPTLATIKGELVNANSGSVDGPVRVAVVWMAGQNGSFNVAEDLPVQPVFPASFSIDLDDPPPASAMVDAESIFGVNLVSAPSGAAANAKERRVVPQGGASSGGQVALGAVVAYLDKNGNGKLDLVPAGASGYVDQILATDESSILIYAQGTLPAAAADSLGHLPSQGYNLYTDCASSLAAPPLSSGSICKVVPDAGPPPAGCSAGSGVSNEWQSISTPITLAVSTDPSVNVIMCQDLSGASSSTGGGSASSQVLPGRPTTYPSPCDPNLACADDGSTYSYTTCQTVSNGICEGTNTSCTTVMYGRLDPVPSDWPCTP